MRNLSKSKINAFRQCPKRLWLEVHKSELRDNSASEASFQIGHRVGEIAQQIYDPLKNGRLIDIAALGHSAAFEQTRAWLNEPNNHAPIFEAGFTIPGALAYADVLLPDTTNPFAWKMIEIKSATSLKDYYREDVAIQSFIAAQSGVTLTSISVAHINNQFVYQSDGSYHGLFREIDLTEQSRALFPVVETWLRDSQEVVSIDTEPVVSVGPQCNDPFACPFQSYCNRDVVQPEYPLSSLPRLHAKKRESYQAQGWDDLLSVPDELLSDIHRKIKNASMSGEAYFNAEGAAADLAPHGFPAYFLDFETAMLPVPIWKGTRPYQQIPFQFSLHCLQQDGTLIHHSFLDLSGEDPSHACARQLIEQCVTNGPVYVYNAKFERMIIRQLATRFPEIEEPLQGIIDRIIDLEPIAREHYYHPSQHGSWSLKAVLPAAVPDLSYDQLDGVKDGMMAVSAYQEAIDPATLAERKKEIQNQLFSYCQLDTFAMVRLHQFLTKH
jgi:CRISPR/Cas system-associated exonuclease Cas4 (RecB family)